MKEDKLNKYRNYNVRLSELNAKLEDEIYKRTINITNKYSEFKSKVYLDKFDDDNIECFSRMLKSIQLEQRLIRSTEKVMMCNHNIISTGYGFSDGDEYRCTKCGLWAKKYHSGELELLW